MRDKFAAGYCMVTTFVFETACRSGLAFYVSLAASVAKALTDAARVGAQTAGSRSAAGGGRLLHIRQLHGAVSIWQYDATHVWQVGCRNVCVARALVVARCLPGGVPCMAVGSAADALWRRQEGAFQNMEGARVPIALPRP